eukprot:11044702-Alexandrium_andersonii.AAC.1
MGLLSMPLDLIDLSEPKAPLCNEVRKMLPEVSVSNEPPGPARLATPEAEDLMEALDSIQLQRPLNSMSNDQGCNLCSSATRPST